ncbi:hypothetical protein MUK42_23512 [Musa troglodytarum]|uniref:Uncharacterized protein n=1 Tax=Musa troglodytarum TaxID=320322 RepID=A0A9E7KAM2_9LILI|nr:hypothetical protein MUK42_23512 [Musa troglodytarum]
MMQRQLKENHTTSNFEDKRRLLSCITRCRGDSMFEHSAQRRTVLLGGGVAAFGVAPPNEVDVYVHAGAAQGAGGVEEQ